jgi:PAS domain S-box-containing protein
MIKKHANTIDEKKMRSLAEKNLAESGLSAKTEPQKLLHELMVQRLELEMQNVELRQQNEQLQKARVEAETAQLNYTRLYDFSPAGYFTIERGAAICESNFCGASLLGVERSLLIGRNFKLFISKEALPSFNSFFESIFTSGIKTSCETVLAVRDKPPVHVYIEGIVSENGQKCLLVVIDISERVQSESRYQKIFESTPIGIELLDIDGRIISANSFVEKMTGYSSEELKTMNISKLYADEAERKLLFEKIGESRRIEDHEFELKLKDGSTREVLENIDLMEWNGRTVILSTLRDISRLRQNEKERAAILNILHFINEINDKQELMQSICSYLQKCLKIEAVEARLLDGDDFSPHSVHEFSMECVQSEDRLCRLGVKGRNNRQNLEKPAVESLCADILSGRFDAAETFFTKRGSFWSNSMSEMSADTTQWRAGACRGCAVMSCESVALIPLRFGKNIFGLIQFSDKRKGRFGINFIEIVERICDSIAIALSQRSIAEKHNQSEARYHSLFMNSPAAVIENDYSKVKLFLDFLSKTGVDNLNLYFENNPSAVSDCLKSIKIIDVNNESIKLFGAGSKKELMENISRTFTKETLIKFCDELKALAGGTIEYEYESPYLSLKGDIRHCITRIIVISGYEKNLSRVYTTILDISDRKEIEDKLKRANEYNMATLNALPDSLFEIDAGGYIRGFHAQKKELLYTDPANFLGKKVSDVLPEEASWIILDALSKALKCGHCSGIEYWLDMPGGVKWFELSISSRGDYTDPSCLFILLARDITERKNQAEGILRLEKRFRHIIENMPAGALLCENDKILINSHIEELSGYSRFEFNSQQDFFNTLFKEGFENIVKIFDSKRIDNNKNFISLSLFRKDGTARNVDISRMIIEDQQVVWIFYDATDYLLVQDKLMKSESHLLEAHRVAHIGSYECNLLTGEIIWSELCYKIMGIKPQKISSELIKSLIHPDDQQSYYSHYFDLFSKNKVFNIEYRIKRPDGKIIYICDEAIIKFDNKGIPLYCIGYYKDITSMKKAAEELHRSQQNTIQLLELSHEGYWAISDSEKTTFVNNRVCDILGYSKEEISEKNLMEFFDSRHAEFFYSMIKKSLQGEKNNFNSQMIHKNGHKVFVNMTMSPSSDDNGNFNGVFALINDFTKQKELENEIKLVRRELTEKYSYNDFIGKSPAMQVIFESLPTIAEADCNALIEGPSGTGKNLIAKIIYNISNRKNKTFVVVNCGTLPENLLESELFGYVKGAFTGADKDKQGKFAIAEGGVVFLDEIGEMPLNLQVKILRIIEEKKYEPVGSNKTMTSDVRIIAATNKDLKKLTDEGKFRADLYFRLKIVSIKIPALKERREDVDILTEYYLNHFNEKYSKNICYVSEEVIRFFKLYDFPGNVRELKNIMERAFIFCNEAILQMKHLASEYLLMSGELFGVNIEKNPVFRNIEPDNQINKKNDQINNDISEKKLIEETILKCGGNKSMAARMLKIDYTTLWRKIKKHGLNDLQAQNPLAQDSISLIENNAAAILLAVGEKEILNEALKKAGNNKTEAGKNLKMSRTTLWRKLKKHNLL